jgi:hypothetical protein
VLLQSDGKNPSLPIWCRTTAPEVPDCQGRSLPLAPLLSYTSTAHQYDIPVPALVRTRGRLGYSEMPDDEGAQNWEFQQSLDVVDRLPWSQKRFAKLNFRGHLNGQHGDRHDLWKQSQRARFHEYTHTRHVRRLVHHVGDGGRFVEEHIANEELAARYLDVSLTDGAVQCAGRCKAMQAWIDGLGYAGAQTIEVRPVEARGSLP